MDFICSLPCKELHPLCSRFVVTITWEKLLYICCFLLGFPAMRMRQSLTGELCVSLSLTLLSPTNTNLLSSRVHPRTPSQLSVKPAFKCHKSVIIAHIHPHKATNVKACHQLPLSSAGYAAESSPKEAIHLKLQSLDA